MPDNSRAAESDKGKPLVIKHEVSRLTHLPYLENRGHNFFGHVRLWVDTPQGTGRDNQDVLFVGMQSDIVYTAQAGPEVPHPNALRCNKLYYESLAPETRHSCGKPMAMGP